MVKRDNSKISADKIVASPTIILPEGHPDIPKFNPNKIIVVPKGSTTSIKQAAPYLKISEQDVILGSLEGNQKDAPDLSDITVHTALTRKQKAGTNDFYYEIVYKIRNSSSNAEDVIGVDARIVGTEPAND